MNYYSNLLIKSCVNQKYLCTCTLNFYWEGLKKWKAEFFTFRPRPPLEVENNSFVSLVCVYGAKGSWGLDKVTVSYLPSTGENARLLIGAARWFWNHIGWILAASVWAQAWLEVPQGETPLHMWCLKLNCRPIWEKK